MFTSDIIAVSSKMVCLTAADAVYLFKEFSVSSGFDEYFLAKIFKRPANKQMVNRMCTPIWIRYLLYGINKDDLR